MGVKLCSSSFKKDRAKQKLKKTIAREMVIFGKLWKGHL